jgi:hypothetical protein
MWMSTPRMGIAYLGAVGEVARWRSSPKLLPTRPRRLHSPSLPICTSRIASSSWSDRAQARSSPRATLLRARIIAMHSFTKKQEVDSGASSA